MTSPPSVEELISAYLDGELDEIDRGRVEQLLARSKKYRRVLAEMRAIRKLLEGLPQQTPSPALETRVTNQAKLPVQTPLVLPNEPLAGAVPDANAIHAVPPGTSLGRLYLAQRRKQRRRWLFGSAAATSAAALLTLAWMGPGWIASRTVSQAVDRPTPPEQRHSEGADGVAPATEAYGSEKRRAGRMPSSAPSLIPHSDTSESSKPIGELQRPAIEGAAQPWSELPPIDAPGFRVFEARDAMQEQQFPTLRTERSDEAQELPQVVTRTARPSPLADMPQTAGEVILLLDQNQDGLVTDSEAQQGLELFRQVGHARRRTLEGRQLVGHLDLNKDGQLSEEEIRAGVASARHRIPGAGRYVAHLLAGLDHDANGHVESDELRALVEGLGVVGKKLEPRLPALATRTDQNQDGRIDAVESQLHADAIATALGLQLPAMEAAAGPLGLTYRTYAQLDRNRDGQLSRREAQRGMQLSLEFDAADADRDGLVSAGEYLDTLLAEPPAPLDQRPFRFRF